MDKKKSLVEHLATSKVMWLILLVALAITLYRILTGRVEGDAPFIGVFTLLVMVRVGDLFINHRNK